MKFPALAALLVLASPAIAITPASASGTAATAYTIDTPIQTLMANAKTKAIVLKHIPAIDGHPAYDQFKAMSLKAVQPFSGGQITDDMIAAVSKDLAALA